VRKDHLCAITILIDEKGNKYPGYGRWPLSQNPKGMDKGNTKANMAMIRSESQALEKLAPGQMPEEPGVVDADYEEVPPQRTINKDTGEIVEKPVAVEKSVVTENPESAAAFDALKSANTNSSPAQNPPAAEIKNAPAKKETPKMTPAEPATVPPKTISGVDMDWLKESITKLKWKNVIVDYLAKSPFNCLSPRISGCLLELGDKPELIAKFLKEIQDRLDMQNPPPPTNDNIPF
jgi:hypothetical protein